MATKTKLAKDLYNELSVNRSCVKYFLLVMVCRLLNILAVNWARLADINQVPTKLSLDILPNNQFAVAAQAGSNISYSLLDFNGIVLW